MSDFDLTKPCPNCPFLKDGGIRVHPSRAREIANCFTDSQGADFPCHQTVDYDQQDEDGEVSNHQPQTSMCAGGMLFAEKQGRINQGLRIAERLGLYRADKLVGKELVFDSLAQMIRAQSVKPKAKVKRGKRV